MDPRACLSLRQLLSELGDMERRDSKAGTLGGTQFQDLKQLLKNLEAEGELGDKAPPFEIQERVHTLCRKFLGGTWKDIPIQELVLTRMAGGMSNMLFLCQLPPHYPTRKSEPDKTLLRVYFNPETESHLVAESVIFTLLSERALGPKLFGIFNGGRLEEYIVSRPLTCQEIRDPIVSRRVAKKLARVHALVVPIEKDGHYLIDALHRWLTHLLELVDGKLRDCVVQNEHGKNIRITADLLNNEIATIRFLRTMLRLRARDLEGVPIHGQRSTSPLHGTQCSVTIAVPDAHTTLDGRLDGPTLDLTMEELEAEADLVVKCMARSHSPVVFCHNDLQEGNILLPKGKKFGDEEGGREAEKDPTGAHRKRSCSIYEKDLVLIDFEYASYNYRSFDFANHFVEMTIDYSKKAPPYFTIVPENFPHETAQRTFFQAYREGEAEMYGGEVEEARVAKLLEETGPFVAISHFFWGVWSLLQLEVSPIEFGFEAYREGEAEMYGGEVEEARVAKLLEETGPFVAISHFFWGVWSLLQLEVSPIEFGFEEYARARLGGYFAWRSAMLSLLEQDPPPHSPIPSRHSSGDKARPPPPPLNNLGV